MPDKCSDVYTKKATREGGFFMLVKCPECSGKIPDTEEVCPICGALLQSGDYIEDPFEEDEENLHTENNEPEANFGRSVKKFLWELFFFLLTLIAIGCIILATDYKGARTELRRMCMTDSGDGSTGDSHYTRIHIKHYILVVLDFFDHGGTGTTTRINPHAFQRRNITGGDSEREIFDKKAREYPDTVSLPPSPPEVNELDLAPENSTPKSQKNPEKEKTFL
jgi:hypothetical protein